MTHSRTRDAILSGIVLTLPLLVLTAPSAAARPDAGTSVRAPSASAPCPLRRVGRSYVRCDSRTGGRLAAPTWLRELDR